MSNQHEILAVCTLHGAKLHEAAESVQLLKTALHGMGASEPLLALLSSENPVAQMLALDFTENALYGPLHEAESHIRAAQVAFQSFVRLYKQATGLAANMGSVSHD